MTISNTTNRMRVLGTNAVGQVIPFAFPITDSSDLNVLAVSVAGVERVLAETTDYTVTIGPDGTGHITTVAAWPASTAITLYRETPQVQGLDLQDGGAFSASDIETALDTLTKFAIEDRDFLSRCLSLAPSDPASPGLVLPGAIARANGYLGFDSAGNPVVVAAVLPAGSITVGAFGATMAATSTAAAAISALGLGTAALLAADADGTLAADSDSRIATQKAVKTYVASQVSAGGAVSLAGSQTFTGVNTFAQSPVIPAPTTALQAATKGYVDASHPSGSQIQVVNYQTGAVATGTTIIPFDDTIPTSGEGTQFMSLAVTPTAAGNTLKIEVEAVVSSTAPNQAVTLALFLAGTVSAIATTVVTTPYAYTPVLMHLTFFIKGSLVTGGMTFQVRIGPSSSATLTLNGSASARKMGGGMASSITVTEIQA
jgi:hypothetical protein